MSNFTQDNLHGLKIKIYTFVLGIVCINIWPQLHFCTLSYENLHYVSVGMFYIYIRSTVLTNHGKAHLTLFVYVEI
jgi:hypothetical protein